MEAFMIAIQDHVINVLNYMQHIHNDPQVIDTSTENCGFDKVFLFVRICHLDTKPASQYSRRDT